MRILFLFSFVILGLKNFAQVNFNLKDSCAFVSTTVSEQKTQDTEYSAVSYSPKATEIIKLHYYRSKEVVQTSGSSSRPMLLKLELTFRKSPRIENNDSFSVELLLSDGKKITRKRVFFDNIAYSHDDVDTDSSSFFTVKLKLSSSELKQLGNAKIESVMILNETRKIDTEQAMIIQSSAKCMFERLFKS